MTFDIFRFLEDARRGKRNLDSLYFLNETSRTFALESEPIDKAGDIIMKVFNQRHLTSKETSLAIWYFKQDYHNSLKTARECLYLIQSPFVCQNEKDAMIKKGNKMLDRGIRDIKRAKEISPLTYGFFDTSSEMLNKERVNNLRKAFYFASEFPFSFKDMFLYNTSLDMAIQREDYETAKELQKKIKEIIDSFQPDFTSIENPSDKSTD